MLFIAKKKTSLYLIIIYQRKLNIGNIFADYMWLHIRAVGEWTNSLYSYFEKEQIKLHSGDILLVENCDNTNTPRKKS